MKARWFVVGGATLALLLLLAVAAPPVPDAYAAPVAREERARNAALLTALAAAGIERAWVDAGSSDVLVVYERPAGSAVGMTQAYALGAAAVVAPDAIWLEAQTTEGLSWRVAAAHVRAYQAGELAREALDAAVLVSAPGSD